MGGLAARIFHRVGLYSCRLTNPRSLPRRLLALELALYLPFLTLAATKAHPSLTAVNVKLLLRTLAPELLLLKILLAPELLLILAPELLLILAPELHLAPELCPCAFSVVFEDSLTGSVAVSRLSSAGMGSAAANELHRTSSNEAVSRHSSASSIDWALVPPVPLMRSNSRRRGTARMQCAPDSDDSLSRTRSAKAEALGPEGRLLSDAAKKIETLASGKRRK